MRVTQMKNLKSLFLIIFLCFETSSLAQQQQVETIRITNPPLVKKVAYAVRNTPYSFRDFMRYNTSILGKNKCVQSEKTGKVSCYTFNQYKDIKDLWRAFKNEPPSEIWTLNEMAPAYSLELYNVLLEIGVPILLGEELAGGHLYTTSTLFFRDLECVDYESPKSSCTVLVDKLER